MAVTLDTTVSHAPSHGHTVITGSSEGGDSFHRYHALDALRAVMMLLGLVLHSAMSYITVPAPLTVWPYADAQTSVVFDMLAFFIHVFRMPTFFVVAGFFAAMLWQRGSAGRFVSNRAARVGAPLVVFWVITAPAITMATRLAWAQRGNPPAEVASAWWGTLLHAGNLVHLWFLYDLLVFYVATIILVPLLARAPAAWHRAVDAAFGRVATTVWGAVLLAAVSTVTLLPMTKASLDTATGIAPPPRVLVAYAVFYTFGLLLYRRRDIIEGAVVRWKLPLAWGALTSVAYLYVRIARPIADPGLQHVVGCVLAALSMWLLIFGITGMFVTHLAHPSRVMRYLADASYWMYLVHLPFTLLIPGLLASSAMPAVIKFLITLSGTTLVCLATYHYGVRATAIGTFLNGRRYARGLPAIATPAVAPTRA